MAHDVEVDNPVVFAADDGLEAMSDQPRKFIHHHLRFYGYRLSSAAQPALGSRQLQRLVRLVFVWRVAQYRPDSTNSLPSAVISCR